MFVANEYQLFQFTGTVDQIDTDKTNQFPNAKGEIGRNNCLPLILRVEQKLTRQYSLFL